MRWQDYALCAQVGGDLWFPADEGEHNVYPAAAKKVCAECPVIEQCLQFAIEQRIGTGVFGGLTAVERRRLIPELSKGQQSKDRVAELSRAGMPAAAIAAALGVTERHVARLRAS